MGREEKIIHGVLHFRVTGGGSAHPDWTPLSPSELTERIQSLREAIRHGEAERHPQRAADILCAYREGFQDAHRFPSEEVYDASEMSFTVSSLRAEAARLGAPAPRLVVGTEYVPATQTPRS